MHLATPGEGEAFFAERWPEARAVSDPDKDLYRGFGLARGSVGQLVGPGVWLSGLKALLKGHGGGRPQGDPLMMSGWFLLEGDRVLWSDVHEHAGAERPWEALGAAWVSARTGSTA